MPSAERAAGTTTKKTTIEEVLPPAGPGSVESWPVSGRPCTYDDLPDFWWYIKALSKEQWEDHIVYVYRNLPRSSDGTTPQVAKYSEAFTQDTIDQNFGGKEFRILMKRRGERLFDFRYSNELAPKYGSGDAAAAASAASNGDPQSTLHIKLLELLERQMDELRGGKLSQDAMKNALEIQATALRSGIETSRALNPPPTAAAAPAPAEKSTFDKLLEAVLPALVTAFVAKLTAPTPDPIEQVSKMMEKMQPFMNPGGGPARAEDWKSIAARNLPLVTEHLSKAVGDWASVQRPAIAGPAQTVGAPGSAAPPHRVAPGTATPPAPTPVASNTIRLAQWLKERLDAGDTGSEIGVALERMLPEAYAQLSTHTADEIFQYFHIEPTFAVVKNHPRLKAALDEFVLYATEGGDTIDVKPAPKPS
jgi:hypothetical protein